MPVTRRLLAFWIALVALPALAQTDLRLGETVEGALTAESDTLDDGRYVETYALAVSGETAFEVVLQSSEFDTYLIVEGPAGERAENDDWEGVSESRVVIGRGAPGRREVIVTSYGAGEAGSFSLSSRGLDREAYTQRRDRMRADSLFVLANGQYGQGDYEGARAHLAQALAIQEVVLGPDHPDVARSLNDIGTVLDTQGDVGRAQSFHERALRIREATLASDHPDVALSLNNLGLNLSDQGDYARALPLLERALAIWEGALGPSDPLVAAALNNLANVLIARGDYARARPLLEQALAIWEVALDPGHPNVASALNNLGSVFDFQGDRARAQAFYERALAIWEGMLGPDHPQVATALNNLGFVLYGRGDYERAQALHERALVIREGALGPAHPLVAQSLNNLANVVYDQGDHVQARALHERSLSIREGALGPAHPLVAQSLNDLANVLDAQGNAELVRGGIFRAGRIRDSMVDQVFPALSAAEQRAFVQVDLGLQTGFFLSHHGGGSDLDDAYRMYGGWKGLLLSGLRRQAAIDRLAADSTYAERADRLRLLRTRVARAYHNGDPALADLTAEKEALERELLAALPDGAFRDPWAEGGLDGLRAALPADGALVDVYRYGHRERGAFAEWRYAAVVMGRAAPPSLVDLGSAEALDAAVGAWRSAATRGRDAAAETAALAASVWGPIGDALPGGAARVWVSPDGPLAGVPWAVLAEVASGEDPRLVALVPSARALLTLLTDTAPPPEDPTALVVGGVAFGPGPDWDPLPATETEADVISALAAAGGIGVSRLAGDAATVPAVAASLASATYAHLATHGFVYAEPVPVREAREEALRSGSFGGRTPGAPGAENWGRSPLALSGLVLAGANTPDDAPGGGVLTAEELVGLDLSGTRLVALSACETGRGAEVAGQGVLGLQSSLTAAGARAVLMSLWSVPDASTAALMTAFYRGLWSEGRSPAEALRRAQAEVRATPGWEAPLHWAGWVISGDAFRD